jgi:sugar/nucleoside kinase (ribokinase family)
MSLPMMDVVHVGSAARDLTDDDPRGWRLGGGASYSALTTARLGLRTAVVIGVDGQAADASELDLLREAGAELLLVPLEEGPVFRNQETPAGRVQGWPTRGHALPVPDLPGSFRRSRAWSLVPVASELGDPWANVVQPDAFTSLAWQGLLREQGPDRLTVRRPPGPSRLLDAADLVGVSRHDLAPGVRVHALVDLLRPGARLAVTDGHDGGRLIRAGSAGRGRANRWAAVPPERLVDPTGAGDVFLAALAGAIVRPDLTVRVGRRPSMAAHLEFAAAAASFVVEAPGLRGVPTREAVLTRLAAHHRET